MFFDFLDRWLFRPKHILIICSVVILYAVVFDGTLFKLRRLYLSQKAIDQKTFEIQTKNRVLLRKLEKLSDPKFLEKEVRNRFDLAGKGDLIFIFPEEE